MLKNLLGVSHLQAKLIVEELVRLGVDTFCISPGARSIPIIKALDERDDISKILFNDERGAAFWAQGYAKRSSKPAVLVCTSGTAVANYLPGVIEASTSQTPMIVISCDRPWEIQNAKANQTIVQDNLFADYVAKRINIAACDRKIFPKQLLQNIDQLLYTTVNEQKPVHLNISFRSPFVSDDFDSQILDKEEMQFIESWDLSRKPCTVFEKAVLNLSASSYEEYANKINMAKSVLIVAGPLKAYKDYSSITDLAQKTNSPIIADINSQLRFIDNNDNVVSLYNLFLRTKKDEIVKPELVLYFGDRIISEPLREYLCSLEVSLIQVNDYPYRQDIIENDEIPVDFKLNLCPEIFAGTLLSKVEEKNSSDLLDSFSELNVKALSYLQNSINEKKKENQLVESFIFPEVVNSLPDHSAVYLSSSLVFREADYCCNKRSETIKSSANRGATGIDGLLSSALGFLAGQAGESKSAPCVLFCGDQAFLHDVNALTKVKDLNLPLIIVLVNNAGGAIFNFFKLGSTHKVMSNEHSLSNFENVVKQFDIDYFSVNDWVSLENAKKEALESGKPAVIEVHVNGEESVSVFKGIGLQ